MIRVEVIDLRNHLTFPSALVGMVALQPNLQLSAGEPYVWSNAGKAPEFAAIKRTLEIAKGIPHEAEKTHFTLLPEYSIPGIEGITLIEKELRDAAWNSETVVIGGTDGLNREDYAAICAAPDTFVDTGQNGPEKVPAGQWVNCCITWVKTREGKILRYLQPKIAPAWPEQNIRNNHMFDGNSVHLFRCNFANGLPCYFFSLVCFDWIGMVDNQPIWEQVLAGIERQYADGLELSWVFVIEHNPVPSNNQFLSVRARFLQDQNQFARVRRANACVIFANSAGRQGPGRVSHHGHSSLVFSPLAPFDLRGCHPTYSGASQRNRGSDGLDQCLDVFFREGGACIYSFSQRVTHTVNLGVAGRTAPLHRALVHSILPGQGDPRAADASVPAAVKWMNDSLDNVTSPEAQLGHSSIANLVPPAHQTNVVALRQVNGAELERRVNVATCPVGGDTKSVPLADSWAAAETEALAYVLQMLAITRVAVQNLEINDTPAHASFTCNKRPIEIVAVHGRAHDECLAHANRNIVPSPHHRLVVVSCDARNTALGKRSGSFITASTSKGAETKFTDPTSARIHISFHEILAAYQNALTKADLEASLYACCAA